MNKKTSLNIQIGTSLLYLVTLIISILLTYNEKLNVEKKDNIFTEDDAYKINVFNRSFILILFFVYLYLNYDNFKRGQKEGKNTKYLKLQLIPSLLSIVGGIIVLYIVIANEKGNIFNISFSENPTS